MSPVKVAMPEQDPDVRNKNFDEVALGYTAEMAMEEATRCLNCKNKPCVSGCPVNVPIPDFIAKVAEGDLREHTRSSPVRMHFLPSAEESARRKTSAKANVSAASKENRSVSDGWNGLWPITIWNMQRLFRQKSRRTERKWR